MTPDRSAVLSMTRTRPRRRHVAVSLCIALGIGCKEKDRPADPASGKPPVAPVGVPSDARTSTGPDRPSLPTPANAPTGAPLTIEEVTKILPAIEGKQILALKQTSDLRQVHGTWCIDGDSAEDVAKKVGRLMADAGYTALNIRGDARKAGVQGDRDGYRMSMIVSASSAASCAAPLHYFASATIFRP